MNTEFIDKFIIFTDFVRNNQYNENTDSYVSLGYSILENLSGYLSRSRDFYVRDLYIAMTDIVIDMENITTNEAAPNIEQHRAYFLEVADSLLDRESNVALSLEEIGIQSTPINPILYFGSTRARTRKTRKSPKKQKKSVKRSRKAKKSVKRSSKGRKTTKK